MKKTIYEPIILGVLVFLLGGCLGIGDSASYTDEDLGLRKTSLFDENIALNGFAYVDTPAGESQNIARSFENAPPLIPHSVEDMMEITQDINMCTSCHLPEVAADINATSIPKTHLASTFVKKDLKGEMDEARYNCTSCHVPQTVGVTPLIANTFQAEFRDKNGASNSNLIDKLNEGIQ